MNQFNFNELTLDTIGESPLTVKIAIVSMLSILLICLGYWVWVKPKMVTLDSAIQKEATLRSQFEIKAGQAENLDGYKNQLAIIKEKFDTLSKYLPAKNQLPALLKDISQTGREVGLTFELFAPQKKESHDFYIDLPIKIKVLGSYDQLAVFVSRVAQMPRMVTLHDFVIRKGGQGLGTLPPALNKKQLEMDITIRIYKYRL